MNASEKWNGYGEWRLMETMWPTQARIPMLNGILLLQFRIYGHLMFLDGLQGYYTFPYNSKIEFEINCNLHGERKSQIGVSWTLGYIPLTLMTYMTPMMEILWHMTSLTHQVEIENPIDLSCDLEKPNGFLLNLV